MTPILTVLLVLTLLTSNITKWFLVVGPRLSFYFLPLTLFTLLVAVDSLRRPFVVPRPLLVLSILKLLTPATILLTLPIVMSEARLSMDTFFRGFAAEGMNSLGLIAAVVFITRLNAMARRRLLDWYLIAVGMCAAFTLAEAVAAYGFGIDLDRAVTPYMPLWSGEAPTIERDMWGVSDRLFYRLNGLSGDANLNAVTLLLSIPIAYHSLHERLRLSVALLIFLSLAIIGQSLSVTTIPQTVVLLGVLTVSYIRRGKLAVLIATTGLIIGGAYLWMFELETVQEVLRFKLDPTGTTAAHIEIGWEAIGLWLTHPLGVGVGGFAVYSRSFSAHNSYLQALVEMGPLGVIAISVGVLYAMRIALRTHTSLRFPTVLACLTLLVSSIGLDVLRRFEFLLVIHMLAAVVILDERESVYVERQGIQVVPQPRSRTFPATSPQVVARNA